MSSVAEDEASPSGGGASSGERSLPKRISPDNNTPSITPGRFAPRRVIFANQKIIPGAKSTKTDARVKPIVVPNTKQKDQSKPESWFPFLAKTLKQNLSSGEYVLNNLTHAVQIFMNGPETQQKLIKILESNNIQYYTYAQNAIKFAKFVLYGLNSDVTGEIINDLKLYGLEPVDVKPMRVRFPKYHDHANYLIYFDAEDKITLPILSKVKYISNTVVRWSHYRPPQGRCTQCRNCLRFNHSTSTCNMNPRCMICAEDHRTDDCELVKAKIKNGDSHILPDLLKCALCGGNHTAASMECPRKQEFIAKKNAQTASRTRYTPAKPPPINYWTNSVNNRRLPNTPSNVQLIIDNDDDQTPVRPPLQHRRQQQPTKQYNQPSLLQPTSINRRRRQLGHVTGPVPSPNKPKQITADTSSNSIKNPFNKNLQFAQNNTFTKNLPDPNTNNTNNVYYNYRSDLLEPNEVGEIFREMLFSIRSCSTREEQLNTLMTLALKYI